jgi:hypothetical protein
LTGLPSLYEEPFESRDCVCVESTPIQPVDELKPPELSQTVVGRCHQSRSGRVGGQQPPPQRDAFVLPVIASVRAPRSELGDRFAGTLTANRFAGALTANRFAGALTANRFSGAVTARRGT